MVDIQRFTNCLASLMQPYEFEMNILVRLNYMMIDCTVTVPCLGREIKIQRQAYNMFDIMAAPDEVIAAYVGYVHGAIVTESLSELDLTSEVN